MAFPDYDYDYYEDFEDALSGDWSETDPNNVVDGQSTDAEYRGSQGAKHDWNGGNTGTLHLALGGTYANFSIGFWFKLPNNTNGIIMFQDAGQNIRLYYYDSYFRLRGTDWTATTIAATQNTWYWLTLDMVRNGISTLRVYDTNDNQVGSDSTVTAYNAAMSVVDFFGGADDNPTAAYLDEVVVDITDATWPLLGWETGAGDIVILRRRRM